MNDINIIIQQRRKVQYVIPAQAGIHKTQFIEILSALAPWREKNDLKIIPIWNITDCYL